MSDCKANSIIDFWEKLVKESTTESEKNFREEILSQEKCIHKCKVVQNGSSDYNIICKKCGKNNVVLPMICEYIGELENRIEKIENIGY